eukprot:1159652-Pelagomonas_calceolata.AAC.2
MHATLPKLLPAGHPTGFFCLAGCPILDALALASLAWSTKSCWVGVTGFSHYQLRSWSLSWWPGGPFLAQGFSAPESINFTHIT